MPRRGTCSTRGRSRGGRRGGAAHCLYPDLPPAEWPGFLERYPNLILDATNVLSVLEAGTPDREAFQALLDRYRRRFVFGTDYPMGIAYPVGKLYRLAAEFAPSRGALEDLLWRSAARLTEPRRLPLGLAADLSRGRVGD